MGNRKRFVFKTARPASETHTPPDRDSLLEPELPARGSVAMVPAGQQAVATTNNELEYTSVAVRPRDAREGRVGDGRLAPVDRAPGVVSRHVSPRLRSKIDNLIAAFIDYYDEALSQPDVASNPPLHRAMARTLDPLESLPRGTDGLVEVDRNLEPQQQVVARYLNGVLASVTSRGPRTDVFLLLKDFARHMQWTQSSHETYWDAGVSSGFRCGYAWSFIVGPGAFIESDKVGVGFYMQAPGALYPPHHHPSGELYGRGPDGSSPIWRQSGKAPAIQPPGTFVWHPPFATHYMDTRTTGPMLNTFSWVPNTSSRDLHCESTATDKGWSMQSVYELGGGDDHVTF